MTLKKFIITASIAALTLPLSACQDVGKGSRTAADNVKEAVEDTKASVKRLLSYKPEDEEFTPIPYTFCYQTLTDINCYTEPLPEARGRLVGWQGRGEFNIKDTSRLPAKTALVRQPRTESRTVSPLQRVFKEKKLEAAPEAVSLEPVFIPEAPKVQGDDKVVTIKIDKPDDSSLY